MYKVSTVGKKSARTYKITRKTPNTLIERNIDRDRRTKDRQDIFWVLRACNVVMETSNDVLAASK